MTQGLLFGERPGASRVEGLEAYRKMPCDVFLFVAHNSESLSDRLYLEPFGGDIFLHWWMERFRSRHPGLRLGVVTTSEGEGSRILRSGCCPPWVEVFPSKQGNKRQALLEAAGRWGSSTFAVCNLEYAFAPPGILDVVLAHHTRHRNNYTLVQGLPTHVAPEIFDTELLNLLSELRLPNLSPDPATALEQLRSLGRRGLSVPLPLHHRPLNAVEIYGVGVAELPSLVSLRAVSDLQIAAKAEAEGAHDRDPLAELRAWAQDIVSRNEDLRRRASSVVPLARRGHKLDGPPRVLFVSNQSAFSGAEASLCQLASHIDKARFSLFAAVGSEGAFTERLREADVRVVCPGYGFGSTHIEQAVYLGELISQIKPDIVHLNALAPPETLFMLLLCGIPFVTHYRVSEIAAFADQVKASTRVVAVSQFCRSQVVRAGVHESRVCVIYDEVDTKKFAPDVIHRSDARRQMAVPLDAFVILMIARFAPNKRHDLFLKAVEEARRQAPSLRVILKGESHGEDSTILRVREHVAVSGPISCVEIIPFVEDIRICHASADVLVLWSDREALGRCVVEGMSMGLPVIVTDSGGARELVKEGETGFVRPSSDASGLARLLVALSRDPAQRERIGLNARLFAKANLDARVSAAKMIDVYDSMLAKSPARPSGRHAESG